MVLHIKYKMNIEEIYDRFMELEDKLYLSNMPEVEYIIMGIRIVESKLGGYEALDSSSLICIIENIENECLNNRLNDLSFSVTIGLEMGINILNSFVVKSKCR